MATFVETFETLKSEMASTGISYDAALFEKVTKALGPVIYNKDASRVSCSDEVEMTRVKNNFLIGKLGLADGPQLDAALKEVCAQLGSSNRNKYRAMFYYLLIKKFGKESMYK